MLYSPTAQANGGSGFFFPGSTNTPADAFPVADSDVQTAQNLSSGTYSFTLPKGATVGVLSIVAPTSSQVTTQQWLAYQAQAKKALSDSDVTMHRIGEGVSLGKTSWTALDVVAFVQWRQSLRNILAQKQPATIPTSLPVKPPYPVGT